MLRKGSQRLKKNDQLFNLLSLFFHFKCHKKKCCMLFFTPIKLVARVLVHACAIAYIKWIRLIDWQRNSIEGKGQKINGRMMKKSSIIEDLLFSDKTELL